MSLPRVWLGMVPASAFALPLITTSHAPAVALGVLQSALHFFAEHLRENGCAYNPCSRPGEVRRSVAATQHPQDRLFHPLRLE